MKLQRWGLSFIIAVAVTSLGPAANAQTIRITGLKFLDEGTTTATGLSIDTTQGTCQTSADEPPTAEPFFDTLVGITIKNESTLSARLQSFTYSVRRGAGVRQFKSRNLSFIGDIEIGAESEKTVYGILLSGSSGRKLFPGTNEIVDELGIRNIPIRVKLRVGASTRTIAARSAVVIGNKDRCS